MQAHRQCCPGKACGPGEAGVSCQVAGRSRGRQQEGHQLWEVGAWGGGTFSEAS